MIYDWVIAGLLVFVCVGQFVLFWIRRGMDRDLARVQAAPVAFAHLQHNLACGAGEWPHVAACWPKIGEPEEAMVRFMMIAQSSAHGVGMLPAFICDLMKIPGPVKFEEAAECTGDD